MSQDFSLKAHIGKLVQSFFYSLHQKRAIRRSFIILTFYAAMILVCGLINSLINYCNCIFTGNWTYSLDRSQSILNAQSAIRLRNAGNSWPASLAITTTTYHLHTVPFDFLIADHCCKASPCIADLCKSSRSPLLSAAVWLLIIPQTLNLGRWHSRLLDHQRGTTCQLAQNCVRQFHSSMPSSKYLTSMDTLN